MKSIDVFTRDFILKMVSLNNELNKTNKIPSKIEDIFIDFVKAVYPDISSNLTNTFWQRDTPEQPIFVLFKFENIKAIKLDIKLKDMFDIANFLSNANATLLDNYDIHASEFKKNSHYESHRLLSSFLEKAIGTSNFPISEIETLREMNKSSSYGGYDFSIIKNAPIFKAYLEGLSAYLHQNNTTIEKAFNIDQSLLSLKKDLSKRLNNKEKISLGF